MKRHPLAIALAACSFALQLGDGHTATVQVTPAGVFHPADGRQISVPGWRIDAAAASQVIQKFKTRKTPLVVDYEHQTLRKEQNGQPAPAAAWFKSLEWRDGQGLFATVELTAKAKQAIADREYLYFSPVFRFHPTTGEVLALEMGALTNTPAIDGMQELSLRAAACFGGDTSEDDMNLLQQLIALLAMNAASTEEQVLAALNAKLAADPLAEFRSALGVDDKADTKTLVAACTALRNKNPDPSQYVPVAVLTAVQGEVADLSRKLKEREQKDVEALIAAALADGRLMKPMEKWARDLAAKDLASLNSYLQTAEPLAALNGTQTQGQPPAPGDSKLTADEVAVCSRMGITEAEYLKAKTAA